MVGFGGLGGACDTTDDVRIITPAMQVSRPHGRAASECGNYSVLEVPVVGVVLNHFIEGRRERSEEIRFVLRSRRVVVRAEIEQRGEFHRIAVITAVG